MGWPNSDELVPEVVQPSQLQPDDQPAPVPAPIPAPAPDPAAPSPDLPSRNQRLTQPSGPQTSHLAPSEPAKTPAASWPPDTQARPQGAAGPAPQQTHEQEYKPMVLGTINAADRDRRITWKAKSPFVPACIRIDGVDVPGEELRKEGGSAVIPAGKSVLVIRMEARVEEL